jgi:vanillate O-demethylase monooxygenase subunit
MFLRNAWYFAGFSEEIGQALFERTLLGESIALFRKRSGEAAAIANRCPHRFAPLTMGRLIDDRVQCAYHGIEFDAGGRCVHIPGSERIPESACVRAYPLVEKWGCLWIWMGEIARADAGLLIDGFRYMTETGWKPVWGLKEVEANYQLVIDNLMDLTHLPFLHPNTLGNLGNAAAAEAEAKTTVQGDTVAVKRVVLDCEPAPMFTRVAKFEGRIDRHQYSIFVPPCFVLIELQVMPAGTHDVARGIEWRVFHIVTPVTETRTRYHWAVTRHFAQDSETVSAAIAEATGATLEEDRVMIEAQARMLEGTTLEARTLSTRFDAAPAQVRRIIKKLVKADTTQTTTA